MLRNVAKFGCLNYGDDILISTLTTTEESNLRTS